MKQRKRKQSRHVTKKGGGESNYARKKIWLHKNAMWGFDVPNPKPWKTQAA